jgi:hypothetical protein
MVVEHSTVARSETPLESEIQRLVHDANAVTVGRRNGNRQGLVQQALETAKAVYRRLMTDLSFESSASDPANSVVPPDPMSLPSIPLDGPGVLPAKS